MVVVVDHLHARMDDYEMWQKAQRAFKVLLESTHHGEDVIGPIRQYLDIRTDEMNGMRNKRFTITGTVKGLSHSDVIAIIRSAGGVVSQHVDSNTDYLLVGERPGVNKLRATKTYDAVLVLKTEHKSELIGVLRDIRQGALAASTYGSDRIQAITSAKNAHRTKNRKQKRLVKKTIRMIAGNVKGNVKKNKAKRGTRATKASGAATPHAKASGAATPGAETSNADTPGAKTSGAEASGAKTSGAETSGADTPGGKPKKGGTIIPKPTGVWVCVSVCVCECVVCVWVGDIITKYKKQVSGFCYSYIYIL